MPTLLLPALLLTVLLIGCGGDTSVAPAPPPDPAAQGRAVLLANTSAATVGGVDALAVPFPTLVYQKIALFTDVNPDLTGTVAAACQAVARIVATPVFGANALITIFSPLGVDTGQALVVAFAGNLDPSIESGVSRCNDSLTAEAALQQTGGRNPEVISLLSPEIPNMPKFHALRELSPDAVPPAQRAALKKLRDSLTYPADGAQIQKIINLATLQKYLDGTFDPMVFGFQAVLSDVESLHTPAELIEGLRLDYPGGFQGQTQVAALVFFQDSTFRMIPPYVASIGGSTTSPYPFTGNGFTATVRGNAIPEWIVPEAGVNLQDGSQLFLIDEQGNRLLQATLSQGHWIAPDGTALTRTARQRTRVDRPARYRGYPVYVISHDEEFYYVNVSAVVPEGLLVDQHKVGPCETRGCVLLGDAGLNLP